MYCKHCGAEISEASRFCESCGTDLTEAVADDNNKITYDKNSLYCTNCGEKIGKLRDCPKCHLRTKKNYKSYCKYCGGKIENKKCLQCEISCNKSPFEILGKVICMAVYAYSILLSLFMLSTLYERDGRLGVNIVPSLTLFILTIIIAIFFNGKRIDLIKKRFNFDKTKRRIVLSLIYILVPIIAFCASTAYCMKVTEFNDDHRAYAVTAVENDLRGKLKNPDSLEVNGVSSYYTEDESYYYYFVVVDYSAQNGFGGYNRNKYYGYVKVSKYDKTVYSSSSEEYNAHK